MIRIKKSERRREREGGCRGKERLPGGKRRNMGKKRGMMLSNNSEELFGKGAY